jgi:hypothetical protein
MNIQKPPIRNGANISRHFNSREHYTCRKENEVKIKATLGQAT